MTLGATPGPVVGVSTSTRHLSAAERPEFASELVAALSDAAELAVERKAHEVIAGWRATARIKAGKGLYAAALVPTEGDFGRVEALG